MASTYLLSAWALGLLGSLHCVGMCGPIALSLPTGDRPAREKVMGRLAYNLGRTVTYAALGFVAGLIGFSIALQGFQSELSLVTGIVIILAVLLGGHRNLRGKTTALVATPVRLLKKQFLKYFRKGSLAASFVIGLLNGLLPCGFVYIALAGAAATGHFLASTAYMTLFGLGTVPALFFLGVAGQLFGTRFGKWFRKATPVIAVAIGLLLIYRADTFTRKACHHAGPEKQMVGK